MSGSHIEMNAARNMIEATREAMEGMIVRPTHVVLSHRVAAILWGQGYALSPYVTVMMPDGSTRGGDQFEAPERVAYVHTPKPLGRRARRRAKARAR